MLLEYRVAEGDLHALVSVKSDSMSVCLNEREVYSFDLAGRLLTAWVGDQTYVRALDNRVVKKWREPGLRYPWKQIVELSEGERCRLFEQVFARIGVVVKWQSQLKPIHQSRPSDTDDWVDVTKTRLQKIMAWDVRQLETERERFESVYSPVSILPPDQYFSLVLQGTEGCHWNRCTFCHFYRHTQFRIKSGEEFARHIETVKAFFGDAIGLRRSVFLADANALVIPQTHLLQILDQIHQAFSFDSEAESPRSGGNVSMRGIFSFLDVFTGEQKTEEEFRQLRERHVRRVTVGVETGCDELLEFLNKPTTSDEIIEVLTRLKRAGMNVGVIILIGVGGDAYDTRHVDQTVQLLNRLNLGKGDIVYFSPLHPSSSSDYVRRVAEQRIRPLTAREQQEQLASIRSNLRFSDGQRPRISLYDTREFVY